MSRFKEKRRIDAAIEQCYMPELSWALSYCKQRFESSSMQEHEKHWRKLIKEIKETIHELESGGSS